MVISALLGLATGVLPDIIKFFKDRQDKKHEIEVMKLQIDMQRELHTQRLEEIQTQADITEQEMLYKYTQPQPSGIKVVDAIIQFANGIIRPVVTGFAFYLYVVYRLSIHQTWLEFDQELLMYVLSYWFGQRQAGKVFGYSDRKGR